MNCCYFCDETNDLRKYYIVLHNNKILINICSAEKHIDQILNSKCNSCDKIMIDKSSSLICFKYHNEYTCYCSFKCLYKRKIIPCEFIDFHTFQNNIEKYINCDVRKRYQSLSCDICNNYVDLAIRFTHIPCNMQNLGGSYKRHNIKLCFDDFLLLFENQYKCALCDNSAKGFVYEDITMRYSLCCGDSTCINTLNDNFIIELERVKVEEKHICFHCKKLGCYSKGKCSGCLLSYYCSKECQKANWSDHKLFCHKKLK